ncbi:MAG: leucine--tRNA ligase, partial [Paracoccaceae bacterium]
MDTYEAETVETKWQQYWDENATNVTDLSRSGDKFYNLMMFPYPSAEGLHIGNIYAFTGADIQGRYRRLAGHNVFQPIGFDAFGINAENFAIKSGSHPAFQIPANIENFRRQLKSMGIMYDWSRAVDTTQPDYYRWTQWIFVKFFEQGLVEHREAPVNWCPVDKTVLSNEQVIDGMCERCGTQVELRLLKQWFFKITDFAERLLDNVEQDDFDWSPSTKLIQKNWIGRSEGAEVTFDIKGTERSISVFTTRPDTLFGVTFMVLAPENPAVAEITSDAQRAAVEAYVNETQQQDLNSRRRAEQGDKSGVATGGFAVHPITGEDIPIYVADYVMMDYGSGAVMGVAAHDTRDFEFAQRHGLPIVPVIECGEDPSRTSGDMAEAYTDKAEADRLINSGACDGLSIPDAMAAVTKTLANKGAGSTQTTYRLHDWCVSRQRYWGPPIPIIHCDTCGPQPVPEADLPVLLPELEDFRPSDD